MIPELRTEERVGVTWVTRRCEFLRLSVWHVHEQEAERQIGETELSEGRAR